jgi:benzoate-CoA ligase
MRDRFNLAARLLGPADTTAGTRIALREPQREWTYDELADTVARLAAGLHAIGVRAGDRVCVLMPDGLEAACAILGIVHMGAICVPLSELQRPNDVRAFARDAGAAFAIVHESLFHVLDEVRPELPSLREVVVVGVPRGGEHAFDALVADHRPAPPADTDAGDLGFILYSTRPSQRPRGVAHRHDTPLEAYHAYTGGVFPIDPHDRVFCPGRLATAFGLGAGLVFPLAARAQSILLPQQARSRALVDLLGGLRPTLFVAPPSLFAQLLADLEHEPDLTLDAGSLRACITGGEPVPALLPERLRARLGVEVLSGYGLTEAFHFVIATPPGRVRPGAAGFVVPGFEARVIGADGQVLPPREIGTLEVRGPTLAARYWNREEDSQVVFVDGWLRTADRFFFDDDGNYFHTGRSDDLFKVGGKWVSPGEVERTLLAHEAVWQCAVIGVEDEQGLNKPLAYVVPNVGFAPSPELERELIAHVKREIAPYKYPRWVEFVDELPMTPHGRVQRYKLPHKRPARPSAVL